MTCNPPEAPRRIRATPRIRRSRLPSSRTAHPARGGHGAVRPRGTYGPYAFGYEASVLAGRGDDVVDGRPGALAAGLTVGGEELAHRGLGRRGVAGADGVDDPHVLAHGGLDGALAA